MAKKARDRGSTSLPKGYPVDDVPSWIKRYKADARADKYRIIREELAEMQDNCGLKDAREFVDWTIQRVVQSFAYKQMDGRDDAISFLRMQTYNPALSTARYRLWFQPCDAWILIERKRDVDLVDLFDSAPGFHMINFEHIDGSGL